MERNLDPDFLIRNIRSTFVIGGVYEEVSRSIWDHHRAELAGSGFHTFEQVVGKEPMAIQLFVKRLTESALMPTKAHKSDAGWDLYLDRSYALRPGETVDASTGVAFEIPGGFWVMLVGRSSTLRKRGLLVNTGIIDTGYRGELYLNLHNPSKKMINVLAGERLGQAILMPMVHAEAFETASLTQSERGNNGFGSSGL